MEHNDLLERKVPSNLDAERFILGSMLVDNQLAIELEGDLDSVDFYDNNNKIVFNAIKTVIEEKQEVGATRVIEVLVRNNQFDSIGGNNFIFDLINEVPVLSEVDSYIAVLKEKSIQRALLNAVKKIYDTILTGKVNLDDLLNNAVESINDIAKNRRAKSLISMDRAATKTFEIIEGKKNKEYENDMVLSGYRELDEVIHGLGRGALIIIAARPSIGKSTFALNIASNVSESGKKVAFFSLEMGYDQLVTKIFASESSISMTKLISGELSNDEMSKLLITKNYISEFPLFFDDDSNNELNEIKAKCQQLKREENLDLIVIDYLQLLSIGGSSNMNRVQEVGKISRGLKVMARSLNVPIIALSQLSRSVDKQDRADKTPNLSDLRESGSIEQDADIVMFLHRDKITDENAKSFRSSKTDLIIAKNRNGETKKLKLIFNGAHSKFSEASEDRNEGE